MIEGYSPPKKERKKVFILYPAYRLLRRWDVQVVSRFATQCFEGVQITPQDVRACVLRLHKFLNTFSVGESCYLRRPPSNLVTFEKLPRCGALDMHDTARSFYHDHNVCMLMTSVSMLNPGCSAEPAQTSHSFISTIEKRTH